MRRGKTGQSVLEYVVILTAIVAAVIVAVVLFGKRDTSSGLGKILNKASSKITTSSGQLKNIVP